MDKRELVELTIERLLANFERSPESFDLRIAPSGDLGGATITWRPRIKSLDSYDSNVVDDPNNTHAVVVTVSSITRQVNCYLFIKSRYVLDESKADHSVSCCESFMYFRSYYRKLKKLVELIQERDARTESMTYLTKLSSVFPDSFDGVLLK